MSTAQFLRAHTYTTQKASGVLAEADRQDGATSHIQHAKPPKWRQGSRAHVDAAIAAYMAQPAQVRLKTGKTANRKRRHDHRCLTAGVISWPDPTAEFSGPPGSVKELQVRFATWLRLTEDWLKSQYGDSLVGMCLHTDESHPHLHFFVVGDAQRLHPGLKAELVDDYRINLPSARYTAHKQGLKAWLDDYHGAVGAQMGLERNLNARPAWRIQDRATRAKLHEIDKQLRVKPDELAQALRDQVWDEQQKTPRPDMRF